MKSPLIISFVTAICLSPAISAQTEADTLRLDYARCVDYARSHNVEMRRAALAGLSARQQLKSAQGQWLPSVDFASTQGFTNIPWGEGTKNQYASSYGLNAHWSLLDLSRSASIKREKLSVEKADEDETATFRSIETEILSIYINLLYQREAIAVNRSMAEVSAAQAQRALLLMQSGKIARPEYAQLQAQADADTYSIVSAEAAYESQLMDLKRLLEIGISPAVEIADVDFADSQVTDPLPPLSESYDMALLADASLRSSQISEQMAQADVAAARAGYYPTIGLSAGVGAGYYSDREAGWGTQMKQSMNENVGLTLSVPIFNKNQTSTAVELARIAQLNSQLDTDARQTELARELDDWYVNFNSSARRFIAGQSQLQSAQLSAELINEKFAVGYVQVTEMIQAHSSLASARHELIQAKYMAVLARKMIELLRTSSVTL